MLLLTKQTRKHSRGQDLTVTEFQILPYPKETDCLPLYSKLRQCGLSKLIEGIQTSRSIFSLPQLPLCLFILTPSCPGKRGSLCKDHAMYHFELECPHEVTPGEIFDPWRQRQQQRVGKQQQKKSCYLYIKLNLDLLNILANLCHNYFGPFCHPKAFCGQNVPLCCCLTLCIRDLWAKAK